jgi:long-chain acyl-CoA synthetase
VVADSPTGDDELAFGDLLVSEPGELPEPRDPESLAVLLYTSGTSGRPRAAMLTHRALLANIDQVAAVEPPLVRGDDVVYGVLPLFHVYGLNAVLGQVLHACATLVVADTFEPIGSIAEIEQYRVSVVPVAPAVLAHWRSVPDLAERLAGVRTILSGSAPLSAELVAELAEAGVVVQQGYGLTEAAPVVTSTLASTRVPGADTGVPKAASVGAALPGVTLRLVDETGEEPAPGDPGEILVKGDNLFEGYWPDADDGPVDGWFATGDVGIIDGEGDLFLVDRLKELVIVSGFNVYPSEVEEVLSEVDGVEEAAVVGVPDDLTGEAVVAYVRSASTDPAELDDLRERLRVACDQRLARFKQPSRLEFVTELPRTVTGKVAKGRLRSTVRREHLGLLE